MLVRIGLWAIAIGLVLAIASGPLNRFGVIKFGPALGALAIGTLAVLLGTILALVGYAVGAAKGAQLARGSAWVGIVVGVALLVYLGSWLRAALAVPPIHEISTDLESPPPFVALKAVRDRISGVNSSDYVIEQQGRNGLLNVPDTQRKAYPDIQPLLLEVPPTEAFGRVEAAIKSMGWEIVAAEPGEGRLEATDTTLFFGFKDDVVVRLRSEGSGTRVDVRSKSRVGLGDAGTNAKRVRRLLEKVKSG
jgi:uncharacterized protein (DUF1499 family)